uniref:K Homology domain-containing protein n=1 Tax=Parascaris univalens TaxID=6257 RepID=A0A915BHF8_PARUN
SKETKTRGGDRLPSDFSFAAQKDASNIVSSKSQECVELCRDRIESLIVDTRKRAYY